MSAPAVVPRATSRLRRSFQALFRRIPATVSFVVLVGVVGVAIAAPAIAPHDPYAQNLDRRLTPPVWAGGTREHLLGTDQLGRDVLSRLIFGTRISLLVGVTAVSVAGVTGVAAGVAAGFYGGLVDEVLMRLADLRLALPFVLLVIAVIAVFGPSLFNVIVVLSLTGWVLYARVIRAEVLAIREREFILAARAMGATDGRLMLRHILPNTIASAIVIASLELANMILVESFLSFLGLGVQPPVPSWGNMLGEGRDYLMTHSWLATLPGLAISVTSVSINLLGDWLRDVLDPRLVV
jgi:peptide/nickel transport system permease protein